MKCDFSFQREEFLLQLTGVLLGSMLMVCAGCTDSSGNQEEVPVMTSTFPETTAAKTTTSHSQATTTAATSTTTTTSVTTSTTTTTITTTTTATPPPPTEPPATQAPTQPSATEAPAPPAQLHYFNGILIANKSYSLPADFNPGMDPTCLAQFEVLRQAAAAEGLNIYNASDFRSYQRQEQVYNSFVNAYGREKADTISARPGHSEHQTGLAIDVNTITDSFANTPEAAWLAAHAHEYGFIICYPKGKEHITGYKYEPWHLRYLGLDTAAAVYESGLCLEEYLGITSCYAE